MNEEMNTTEPTNEPTDASKMSVGTIVLVLIVSVLVAGGIYWLVTSDSSLNTKNQADLTGSGDASVDTEVPMLSDLPDVVAEVNGVAITKAALEEGIAQTEALYAQQGADPTDPAVAGEVRAQALDTAINNEVLAQAAAAAGTSVDSATVEAEIDSIRAQFPDEAALTAELETAGLTLDELRENITDQLTLNEYITSTEEFLAAPAATEAEARELYEQSVSQASGQAPSFEEVQAQIEAQITQQNQQAAVAELVAALREAASIEMMI